MKEIEVDGKTVTIAVESGLSELGLRRDQVEVEVLEEGSAGFLGLGSKPARVRIREKQRWGEGAAPEERRPAPSRRPAASERKSSAPGGPMSPEDGGKRKGPAAPRPRSAVQERPASKPRPARPASVPRAAEIKQDAPPPDPEKAVAAAQAVLRDILVLAGLPEAEVRCAWDDRQSRVRAEVQTPDADVLIGKDGRTLEALQFLVTVIVGRKLDALVAVQVDTQDYWKGIEADLMAEAERAAGEVLRTGKAYRFEPMEPSLRRLVHRKLASHPDVETASEGEGSARKVVVRPRRKG